MKLLLQLRRMELQSGAKSTTFERPHDNDSLQSLTFSVKITCAREP